MRLGSLARRGDGRREGKGKARTPDAGGLKASSGFKTMERGCIHVYTGDGKGKTTAALGLVMRALGAGLRAGVVQFIKSMEYSEIRMLRRLCVPVRQFGRGCFIKGAPSPEDRQAAERGLDFVRSVFTCAGDKQVEEFAGLDVLVLDEINIALKLDLLDIGRVLGALRSKPAGLEVICTGRGAPPELIEAADLVTEMRNVKHYYDSGIRAREGIER